MFERLRRMPLRSRLALLTALVVAAAVAAVALACWFVTRDRLYGQLDESLKATNVVQEANESRRSGSCEKEPDLRAQILDSGYVQLVQTNGEHCWLQGDSVIPVKDADVEVARGLRDEVLHTVTLGNGEKVRVLTRPASIGPPPEAARIGISVARPLGEIDESLSTLALVLALVAAAGVIGSAGAGVALARAGLRPVERLTGTVEHIAETEDLSVRIPVEGDDEIARLSRSFNAMTEALASSRDRQQQLIADAGHELRTPLTSLRTNIELLARSEDSGRPLPPADRKELLASVTAQMTELAALIGDLQELSRPDAKPGTGPLEVVGLHETAERAVERARLRGTGIEITAELKPWFVRAEPAALERALINLLDNAVKFSPPGGEVEVRITEQGELTVRDHGPGIPAEDLPHVFERFWRSPAARGLPGSGLGLSIVHRTIARAGGTVELRPAPDGGTEAVIALPGAPDPPPAVSAAASSRGMTPGPPADRQVDRARHEASRSKDALRRSEDQPES